MDKLTLVLLDDDREYVEMFSTYIQESSYKNKWIIKTFTQKSAFEMFLKSSHKVHLLAANREMIANMQLPLQNIFVVWLDEENHPLELIDHCFIAKYQPLNQLLDRLLTIYLENAPKAYNVQMKKKVPESGAAQIISVYSAVGGCGKTTVAANLAKMLAFLDYNVFYLNLELYKSVSMFPENRESDDFAKMLYYIKTNANPLSVKLSTLKYVDPLTKVAYLSSLSHIAGIEEISGETIEQLLNLLTIDGEYDYILVDLDHSLHERILKVLSMSDQIIWMMTDDMNCVHKSILLLNELKLRFHELPQQWSNKICYLLNKYTGKTVNDFTRNNIEISGQLPYVPQWKSVHSAEQLMSENVFHGQLLHWFYNAKETIR
jgi:cellulose biosynthesis protein BcsQ